MPDTLSDAVLSRARRLTTPTRSVASAAAVIGRSFDFDLLTAVTHASPDEVAGALRELQEAYFVLPGADAVTFDFRHALIRDTLYADTACPCAAACTRGWPDRRRRTRLPRCLHLGPLRAGGMSGPAYEYAVIAAREASAISAHGEASSCAAGRYGNLPAQLPALDQAGLFAALGDEAAATDDNLAAAEAYQTAHELITAAGDVRAAAALVPRMVAVAHLLGAGLDARVATLQRALDSLDEVAGADRERARLHSAMAAAYLVDDRLDEAIIHGERGRAESQRIGDDEAALNAATTLGSVLVFAGRMDEGWQLLEEAIAARRRDVPGSGGGPRLPHGRIVRVELMEYDRAEHWLTEGVRYAENAELWNHRHYMASHLAHVQWATGQWDAAAQTAEGALADGRGGITTRITAQYVLGYLAMGRGDWDRRRQLLREALAAGERMAELQRLSPPLWGLAEAARCQGDYDTALTRCERGYQASAEVMDAACLFPYLLTGVRAHLARGDVDAAEEWSGRVGAVLTARGIPGTLPAIGHGRGLILLARGDVPAAHQALESAQGRVAGRRRFWEGTWALRDLAVIAAKARRRGEAALLLDETRAVAAAAGATALVDDAERLARSFDPGRPVDPWHPLSEREFEVAQLVAAGLTNRQIAAAAGGLTEDDLGARHAHPHETGCGTPRGDRRLVRHHPA